MPLRILFVEDQEADVLLACRELARHGFEVTAHRAEDRQSLVAALETGALDAIVCDHGLPSFGVLDALAVVQEHGLDVPFVVLSGSIGEEATAAVLRAGAGDVVLKSNMSRLGPAIARERAAVTDRAARRASERAFKESEARKSAILDSALDSIVTIDGEGRVIDFNRAAERTFGYRRGDVLGQPIADLIIPVHLRERHIAGLARYHRTGEGPILNTRVESVGMRADGTEFPVEIAVVPVALPDSVLFTAYIHDITERQRLHQQLGQAQRLESLGRLAGGIAHDFNNLLGVILNYASFVDDALAAPGGIADVSAAREDVQQIQAAAERAARLTRQLLSFARRDVQRPVVVDLDVVVAEMEKILRRTIGEDIELVVRRGGALRPIRMDVGQLEQVIVNLAVNSRHAMPAGGTLIIETSNVVIDSTDEHSSELAPGAYVVLRVIDTGVGMDEATLSHVFEPFFTTRSPGEGSGLGLATVFGIVSQSGGRIDITSAPGRGTTVAAFFPAVDESQTASTPPGE